MRDTDPFRSYPDREFPQKYIDICKFARKEYGMFWSYDEVFATLEFLEKHFPNGGNGFIEIGAAQGASFHVWASMFSGPRISVDFIEDKYKQSAPYTAESRLAKWQSHYTDCYSIIGKSLDADTIAQVSALLDGRQVDWLFIDGDHTYASCKGDFDAYRKFVKPGGCIGFHDIHNTHPEVPGPREFWPQIQKEWQDETFDTDWAWCGIGVLVV